MDESTNTVRTTFMQTRIGRFYLPVLAAALLVGLAGFLLLPDMNSTNTVSARVQAGDSRSAEIFYQVVRLDDATGYSVFGKRGINAEGTSFRGAIGAGRGASIRGGESATPGNPNADQNRVSNDLAKAYAASRQLPCTLIEDGSLSAKTLTGGFYCVSGTTLERGLTFDAQNDPNALMFIRVDGDFDARAAITLANGAKAQNVHFSVDGNVAIAAGVEFKGNILARGDILANEGSSVKGHMMSVDGEVVSRGAELGVGTGFIEICKQVQPGSTLGPGPYTFTFPAVGGGTQSVSVTLAAPGQPVNCSAPREVPTTTPITITETSNGTFAIANATARRVGGVNVPVTFTTTSVTVQVLEGDLNNETIVTVFNQPVLGGFIQICKYPTPGDPVSGTFEFRFRANPAGTIESRFVPVGSCSLPILVTSFVNSPTQPSFVVNVEEVGRDGVVCDSVTTTPANRFANFNSRGIGAGCTVDVTVFAGNAQNQTLVNFFNRSTAELKVCKLLGPGAPPNQAYVFDVTAVPTGGTAPAAFVVAVTPGNCSFVPNANGGIQTFVVGTRATIIERAVANVSVTRIDEMNVSNPVENLAARRVDFGILPGVGVITYTNSVLVPGNLKVCKNAIANVTTQPSFTFDILPTNAAQFEPNFSFGTVTVAGGTCSTPIANIPTNFNILVDERAAAGFNNTATVCQAGTCTLVSTNLPQGQAVIDINENATLGEVIFTNTAAATTPVQRGVRFDFDGDRKADPSIFTPGSATWSYLASSQSGQLRTANFGLATDKLVPADYDGDGRTDFAVYRNGNWYVMGSTNVLIQKHWGEATDIAQPGDYDGDGRADFAIYRPSTGHWWILMASGQGAVYHWGVSTDKPVAADYDGDGSTDITVFRDGTWWTIGTTMGMRSLNFGMAGDIPVPADFDGDSKVDVAVYRGGTWHVLESRGAYRVSVLGTASDKPVPADYDGDGRADLAVYNASNGTWTIKRSSMADSNGAAVMTMTLGSGSDVPLPSL